MKWRTWPGCERTANQLQICGAEREIEREKGGGEGEVVKKEVKRCIDTEEAAVSALTTHFTSVELFIFILIVDECFIF